MIMMVQSQLQEAQKKSNGNGIPKNSKLKSREVQSRYKITTPATNSFANLNPGASSSSAVSRRCVSPSVVRTQTTPDGCGLKRSQSAERKRPSPSPKTVRSSESLWPSTRSASQTEPPKPSSDENLALKSAANVVSPNAPLPRKATPERKRTPGRQKSAETENARPLENSHSRADPAPRREQQRRPGKKLTLPRNLDLTRSVDFSNRLSNLSASINEPPSSGITRRASLESRARTPTRKVTNSSVENAHSLGSPNLLSARQIIHRKTEQSGPSDMISAAESVSSGSSSVIPDPNKRNTSRRSNSATRSTIISGRSLNSTSTNCNSDNRLHTEAYDLSVSSLARASARLKASSATNSVSLNGPERVLASPRFVNRISVTQNPLSPVRLPVSSFPSRALSSPPRSTRTQMQNGASVVLLKTQGASSCSVLPFGIDVRRGKKAVCQVEEAHDLRILHNRLVQWRFVNARAEAAMNAQKVAAEKMLHSVWVATSALRDSVTLKLMKLQQLRQKEKLHSVLKRQTPYLKEWPHLERDHTISLTGAVKALESAIVRVPVTGGARADLQAVHKAIMSASALMQTTSSTIGPLLPKMEGMNNLVSELAEIASKERIVLGECANLLATAALMEVEESSLRAHWMQLKHGKHCDVDNFLDASAVAVQWGQ